MKKYTRILYWITLASVLLLVTLFWSFETVDESIREVSKGFTILTDVEPVSYSDAASSTGISQEYRWTLQHVPARNGEVAFYVVHQSVEVFIDNALVYSLTPKDNGALSNTVGCYWAKVYLSSRDEGAEIRVLVHPLYKSSVGKRLTFYYGDSSAIYKSIVKQSLPIMLVSIAAILAGAYFLLFVLLNYRMSEMGADIALLGIFSVFAGLWKLSDVQAAPLIFSNPPLLSAIALISLPMLTVSVAFFLRNQFEPSKRKILDVVGSMCCVLTITIVLLQLSGAADLRQTLFISHFMVATVSFLMLYLILGELFRKGLSKKLQITLTCCVICLLGTITDMGIYIFSNTSGSTIYGIVSLLIYAVAMGYYSIVDAQDLIKRGRDAERYEDLALHDPLTGIFSRVFYNQYVEKHKSRLDSCFVIMFDINNLKLCNDTKGHFLGDLLLCKCARLLEQAFLPDGICIRLGGDEFCVLYRNSTAEEIESYLTEFDWRLADFNNEHPAEFPVQIAYGYAQFDRQKDQDLNDTLRRADQKMYEMKHRMKEPDETTDNGHRQTH